MTKPLILGGILALATAAGAFIPNLAIAQSGSPNEVLQREVVPTPPQKEATPAQSPEVTDVMYRPPLRGAPGGRVGGASRGAIRALAPLPTIDLLAPADHAGQTVSATPTLYYFVSRPVAWPMQLTISAPLQPAPILEVTIPSARAPGIYPLRLADYRTPLEPGIVYTWSVSIILDPRAWSRNIVASAPILRAPPNLATDRAASATGGRQAEMLAQTGLWYDAVAAAFNDEASGRHSGLDRLMKQVGLTEATHFENTTAR